MRAVALASALVTLLCTAPAAAQLHENGRLAWSYWGPPGYTEDLMTARPDGSDLRRFEPGPATDARDELTPAWSPDGSRLAYATRVNFRLGGGGYYKLHVAGADGTGERLLTSPVAFEDEVFPDWSPDGSRIVYTVVDRNGDIGIWEMAAAGGRPTKLSGDAAWAKYSPDGKWVAYIDIRWESESSVVRVTTRDRSKTIDLSDPRGSAQWPSWSPDGRYVAYTAFILKEDRTELTVARADGSGAPMTLYVPTRPSNALYPAWSPDGGSVVFTSDDHLLKLDLRTRRVTQLTPPVPQDFTIRIHSAPVWARGAPLPGASVPDIMGPPTPASPAPVGLPRLELSGLPRRCARGTLTVRVRSESRLLTLRARVGGRKLTTDAARGRIRVPLSSLSRRPRRLTVVATSTGGLPMRASARLRRCAVN